MHFLVKRIKRVLCPILVMFLLLYMGTILAQTAAGTVYTCKINPSYAHPVTGEIEDAGGSSSTATGQGMVEGALGSSGILEVTDSGEYYLTIRMGLMDYSSGHSFRTQEVGASGWSSVEAAQTGSGSDDSGTTADLRIPVPSESFIVRCSMYVEPMGRDVIFYFYPSDYTMGNSAGMNAEIVTETSASSANASSGGTSSEKTEASQNGSGSEGKAADSQNSDADTGDQAADGQEGSAAGGSGGSGQTGTSVSQADGQTGVAASQVAGGTAAATDTTGVDTASTDSLDTAQGLSLSTASGMTEPAALDSASAGPFTWVLVLTVSITLSGAILLMLTAYIVYLFRKNWRRWGGSDVTLSEEEEEEQNPVFLGSGFGLPDEDDGDVWDSDGVVRLTEEAAAKQGRAEEDAAEESAAEQGRAEEDAAEESAAEQEASDER